MASINLNVDSGGGTDGWIAFAASFPDCLNDGDNSTYMGCDGDFPGTVTCGWSSTAIPSNAIISNVQVGGLWGSGSASSTVNYTAWLGGNSTNLGTIGDVSSFGASIARPGGGAWSRADIDALTVVWTNLQTGTGNTIRFKSCELDVTYELLPTGYLLFVGSLLAAAVNAAFNFLGRSL